jgi:hypothetical protein
LPLITVFHDFEQTIMEPGICGAVHAIDSDHDPMTNRGEKAL